MRTLDAQADALDLRRSTAFRIPCAGSLTRSAFTALPGSRRNFLVGSLIFYWVDADAIRADADCNTRFYQCTRKSASRVVAPEIIDPMMAIDGTTPFGSCRLMSDATKIAAAGNAITK
jgi:hypothetical protein